MRFCVPEGTQSAYDVVWPYDSCLRSAMCATSSAGNSRFACDWTDKNGLGAPLLVTTAVPFILGRTLH
jgi:hypothetical protein